MPETVPAFVSLAQAENWIRTVNRLWIVRGHLAEEAEGYLDHLAATDPTRLEQTCRTVLQTLRGLECDQDPKPCFYAALFSQATPTEKARHLNSHLFTQLLLAKDSEVNLQKAAVLSSSTWKKLKQLRDHLPSAEEARE